MDELAIGRLGTPHGLSGALKLTSYSGEIEHILALETVILRSGTHSLKAAIESAQPYGEGLLVKFAGYDSPEAAKALSGYELWVPRAKAQPLAEDEYYYADLVGCILHHAGQPMATVEGVCDAGAGALFEVRLPGGASRYVPFRKEFVGQVDIAAKRIELLDPAILE